jgi:ribosomal protein S2
VVEVEDPERELSAIKEAAAVGVRIRRRDRGGQY